MADQLQRLVKHATLIRDEMAKICWERLASVDKYHALVYFMSQYATAFSLAADSPLEKDLIGKDS